MPSVSSAPLASSSARGYLLMHGCVVLFGFTAIMGRLITLNALPLVWWRMALAAVALLLVPATWRGLRGMPPRLAAVCVGNGFVLALCWALFYLAIKLANASVGAIALGVAPLYVALGGPLVTRQPWSRADLLLAAAIVPGIVLIVGGVPREMTLGLGIGLLSAGVLTVFSGINKYLATRAHPLSSTGLEMLGGTLFLAAVMALLPPAYVGELIPGHSDFALLVVFALALTALPIALMLVALRSISVFAQQMAVNLEPVYAVLLAIPILGEQQELDALFYLGVVVIVGAVMLEPLARWLRGRSGRRAAPRPELL